MTLRLAGIVAVSNNSFEPIVSGDDFEWAQNLVLRSIRTIGIRDAAGQLGRTDAGLRKFVLSKIKEFYEKDIGGKKARRLKGRWITYHENNLIPFKYLVEVTEHEPMFVNNSTGHSRLLMTVMTELSDQDVMHEFDSHVHEQMDRRIKKMGRCWVPGPLLYQNEPTEEIEDDERQQD